MSFKQPAMVYV